MTAQIFNVSQNNPDIMMIGLNDRDKVWHDLYELHFLPESSIWYMRIMIEITGFDFDWDDNLRVLYQTDEKGILKC